MNTKDMTLVALMTSLLIVSTHVALPIGPVPITLQTLVVLVIGYLLSPNNALLTSLLYLFIGLMGLPVFSGFSGGLQSFLSPSFGFVLGFIPACYVQAKYLARLNQPSLKQFIFAGVMNTVITYFIGLSYMTMILNGYLNSNLSFTTILMIGLAPFLIGDLLKLMSAVFLAERLRPLVRKKVHTIY